MKRLLASQSVTVSGSGVVATDAKLAEDILTSTLGLLARQFFETFVVVAGTMNGDSCAAADDEPPTEIMLRTTVCLEMSPEDYESAKKSVADLVDLRNTLTHHFIELFDSVRARLRESLQVPDRVMRTNRTGPRTASWVGDVDGRGSTPHGSILAIRRGPRLHR